MLKRVANQGSVHFWIESKREHLDFVQEDRISKLPNDIIHRILSFLDMKYVVQTSTLSKRWKYVWTSMTHLNFDINNFRIVHKFTRFVKHALSNRNNHTEVSALELKYTMAASRFVVSIVDYAFSHNVRQLTIKWFTGKHHKLPWCLFCCHTLKHLTLEVNYWYYHGDGYGTYSVPKSAWDFPALETLYLADFRLDECIGKNINLFSKCVNLKELTLLRFKMYGLETFSICAPQLASLTFTSAYHLPKALNVVAPLLKNLTTSLCTSDQDDRFNFLQLSTQGFDNLEKANLSMLKGTRETHFPQLLDTFQKLQNAKFLVLDLNIFQTLHSCLDQLSQNPCPFNNLKYLKIDTTHLKEKDPIPTQPIQVKDYLLENSPNATFIMDLPQRPLEQLYYKPKSKVARLEERIQAQDEVITEQKSINEKLLSHMIKCRMEQLKFQVESGNPDYQVIRSIGCEIKSALNLIPESMRIDMKVRFLFQYKELKSLILTQIDGSQWLKIESQLGLRRNVERPLHSNNIHSLPEVRAAELPTTSRTSSANMATSSSNVG